MVKRAIILAVLCLIVLVPVASFAETIEVVPNLQLDGVQEFKADLYPTDRYSFDSEKMGITDILSASFMGIANLLFGLNILLTKIANFLLVECFSLSIFEHIESVFDAVMQGMKAAVFDPIMPYCLAIAALFALFHALMGQLMKTLSILGTVILVIIIAQFMLGSPSSSIKMIDDVASSLSKSMLAAAAQVVEGRAISENDAVINLSNIYWTTAVEYPWSVANFGKVESDAKREEYLILDPDSDERKALAQTEPSSLFKKNKQIFRLVITLFIVLLSLVMTVMIIMLSGLMFLAQFGAVLATVMSVFALVLAMIPGFGTRVLIQSVYTVFQFIFSRMGVTLLLVTYFVISSVLYKASGAIGWFMVMILQCTLLIAIIMYRQKIFSFVYAVQGGQGAAVAAVKKEREKNAFSNTLFRAYAYGRVALDSKQALDTFRDNRLEKRYTPTAEKHLTRRYSDEKVRAEVEAEKTGKPAEYSDFVKQVDQRVDKGYKPFSLREIKSESRRMVDLHKQDEDPDRLVMTDVVGKSKDQIRTDQAELEKRIYQEEQSLKQREFENESKIDHSVRSMATSRFYSRTKEISSSIGRTGERVGQVGTVIGENVKRVSNQVVDVPFGVVEKAVDTMQYWRNEHGVTPDQPIAEEQQEMQQKVVNGSEQVVNRAEEQTQNRTVSNEVRENVTQSVRMDTTVENNHTQDIKAVETAGETTTINREATVTETHQGTREDGRQGEKATVDQVAPQAVVDGGTTIQQQQVESQTSAVNQKRVVNEINETRLHEVLNQTTEENVRTQNVTIRNVEERQVIDKVQSREKQIQEVREVDESGRTLKPEDKAARQSVRSRDDMQERVKRAKKQILGNDDEE